MTLLNHNELTRCQTFSYGAYSKNCKKTHIWNNNSLIKCYEDESDESADFDWYLDIWDICLNIVITDFFILFMCLRCQQ